MTGLIPIPELWVVYRAALLLLALGALPLSSHLHTRFLDRRGVAAIPAHVVTSALIVVLAVPLTGVRWVVDPDAPLWRSLPEVVAVPLVLVAGVVVGVVVIPADAAVARWYRSRGQVLAAVPLRRESAAPSRVRAIGLGRAAGASAVGSSQESGRIWRPTVRDTDVQVSLWWLLAAAFVEEAAFRGIAVSIVMHADAVVLRVLGVVMVAAVFAVMHLFFGWGQVAAKLPLSLSATAAVLATGSVLPAMIGHGLFNAYVNNRRAVIVQQPVARRWR